MKKRLRGFIRNYTELNVINYMNNPRSIILSFEQELIKLINRFSQENQSNTPDFILAEFLNGCLENYNRSINQREAWYGRKKERIGGLI